MALEPSVAVAREELAVLASFSRLHLGAAWDRERCRRPLGRAGGGGFLAAGRHRRDCQHYCGTLRSARCHGEGWFGREVDMRLRKAHGGKEEPLRGMHEVEGRP